MAADGGVGLGQLDFSQRDRVCEPVFGNKMASARDGPSKRGLNVIRGQHSTYLPLSFVHRKPESFGKRARV